MTRTGIRVERDPSALQELVAELKRRRVVRVVVIYVAAMFAVLHINSGVLGDRIKVLLGDQRNFAIVRTAPMPPGKTIPVADNTQPGDELYLLDRLHHCTGRRGNVEPGYPRIRPACAGWAPR